MCIHIHIQSALTGNLKAHQVAFGMHSICTAYYPKKPWYLHLSRTFLVLSLDRNLHLVNGKGFLRSVDQHSNFLLLNLQNLNKEIHTFRVVCLFACFMSISVFCVLTHTI